MNEELNDEKLPEIEKFISDAKICMITEDVHNKVALFEKIVSVKLSREVGTAEDLENLIKDMINVKFWNTKVFSFFDDIHKIIQKIHHNSNHISSYREKIEKMMEEENVFETLKKSGKIDYQEITNLIEAYKGLPDNLTSNSITDFQEIDLEVRNINSFFQKTEAKLTTHSKKMFNVYTTKKLQACKQEFSEVSKTYLKFAIRKVEFDTLLASVNSLLKASELLETSTTGSNKKDISTWDVILLEVTKLWTDEENQPEIIKKMESELTEAKEFLKIVHQLRNNSEFSKSLMKIEEIEKLIQNFEEKQSRICMDDSRAFLVEIIEKNTTVMNLLQAEKPVLSELQTNLQFMESVSVDFEGKIDTMKEKIQVADAFKVKLLSLKNDKLEREFENFTEEYNRLETHIEEVEKIFNSIQDCKNLRRDGERLLASDEATAEEILDMKSKLIKMKFFRSANLIGRILAKLFYKMREIYEQNSEENKFIIEYCDIIRLISEADAVLSRKCKDEIRSDLKEKFGFLNQIFKDVNEYLSKQVYTLTIKEFKEKKIEDVFRGFVRIAGPILDFKKKMQEKERQLLQENESKLPNKEEALKPTIREEITQENRSFYIRAWKTIFVASKSFKEDMKDASYTAKNLEREVYITDTTPAEYEKTADEVTRLLTEFSHYLYLFHQMKIKKFNLSVLKEFFGKTSAEIRKLNYLLSRKKGPEESDITNKENNGFDGELTAPVAPKKSEILVEEEESGESPVLIGDYKYYRIYSGDIEVQY